MDTSEEFEQRAAELVDAGRALYLQGMAPATSGNLSAKSSDEILYEALRNYLFIHKFRLLREHMTSKAKTQGVCTDQDVFDRISRGSSLTQTC